MGTDCIEYGCVRARWWPQVAALAGARVSHAACGVWHTAAVAAPRPGGCAAAALSGLGALEQRVVRMQQAAAFELLAEVQPQSPVQVRVPAPVRLPAGGCQVAGGHAARACCAGRARTWAWRCKRGAGKGSCALGAAHEGGGRTTCAA